MADCSWALTPTASAPDRACRTAAFFARFEREVDPDRALPPDECARRAESALRAWILELARRSATARRVAWIGLSASHR